MRPNVSTIEDPVEHFRVQLKNTLGKAQIDKLLHEQSLASRDKKNAQDLTIARLMRATRNSQHIDHVVKRNLLLELRALFFATTFQHEHWRRRHEKDEEELLLKEWLEEEEEAELQAREHELSEALREEDQARLELIVQATAQMTRQVSALNKHLNEQLGLGGGFEAIQKADLERFTQNLAAKANANPPSPNLEAELQLEIKGFMENAYKGAVERLNQMGKATQMGISMLRDGFTEISKNMSNLTMLLGEPTRAEKSREQAFMAKAQRQEQQTSQPRPASGQTSLYPEEPSLSEENKRPGRSSWPPKPTPGNPNNRS